jgi:hypothetical protein
VKNFSLRLTVTSFAAIMLLSSCASQEARTARVERTQEALDRSAEGRRERWNTRAEHQDARARAFVEQD